MEDEFEGYALSPEGMALMLNGDFEDLEPEELFMVRYVAAAEANELPPPTMPEIQAALAYFQRVLNESAMIDMVLSGRTYMTRVLDPDGPYFNIAPAGRKALAEAGVIVDGQLEIDWTDEV